MQYVVHSSLHLKFECFWMPYSSFLANGLIPICWISVQILWRTMISYRTFASSRWFPRALRKRCNKSHKMILDIARKKLWFEHQREAAVCMKCWQWHFLSLRIQRLMASTFPGCMISLTAQFVFWFYSWVHHSVLLVHISALKGSWILISRVAGRKQ